MTKLYRTALAAAAALALNACATPQKTMPKTEIQVEAPEPVSTTDSEMTPEMVEAPEPVIEPRADTPAATETLLYGAMTKFELMTFVETVRAANLESALEGPGPLTVFAPNGQAFEFARLGADADVPAILKGHIVKGAMDAAALKAAVADNGAPVTMMSLSGQELTFNPMASCTTSAVC